MIKTLSPYYVTTPFVTSGGVTCTKYTMEIFVWTGNKITDVPSTTTYEITINNPTASTGNSKRNIARLINDFIDFTPNTVSTTLLVESPNQVWVRTQIMYQVGVVISVNPEHIDTQIALQGYGYGLSGENPDTPQNKVLMRVGDYTMKPDGIFIVPIELLETAGSTPSIIIDNTLQDGTTLEATLTFTDVGTYASFYILAEFVSTGNFSYIVVSGITSPQTIEFIAYGEWNISMHGYDSGTNANIDSNTFNITLTA